MKRERMKRGRKEDVDKNVADRWGAEYNKTVHLSGNAEVVPESRHRKRSRLNLDLK